MTAYKIHNRRKEYKKNIPRTAPRVENKTKQEKDEISDFEMPARYQKINQNSSEEKTITFIKVYKNKGERKNARLIIPRSAVVSLFITNNNRIRMNLKQRRGI